MITPHETMILSYGMVQGRLCAECAHLISDNNSLSQFVCAVYAKEYSAASWRLGWLACGMFHAPDKNGKKSHV
jgi:hypothetical protein